MDLMAAANQTVIIPTAKLLEELAAAGVPTGPGLGRSAGAVTVEESHQPAFRTFSESGDRVVEGVVEAAVETGVEADSGDSVDGLLAKGGAADGHQLMSARVRSGADRRTEDRGNDRRATFQPDAGRSRFVKPDIAPWFDDLHWGMPLFRRVINMLIAVAFLAFCVFVLVVTLMARAAA